MSQGAQRANKVAGSIYQRFLQDVLEKHVLAERIGSPLGEELKKSIHAHKAIDTRIIYLMSLSGKGGWDDDPKKWERYRHNQNITLLDHLLSVVRGALMLAALDWLTSNPDMDETDLRQRLVVIAAIGFLHDLDKMLKLQRDEPLTPEHVQIAVEKYGITDFLATENVVLNHEQIRFLIEQAEDSQRYRHPASTPPPRTWKQAVERYVKLADKLDGLWQQHGANDGLEVIMQRLQDDQSLSTPVLKNWEAVELFDPHHPFLLDELQRRLSFACQRLAGIPPLLEIHQDGQLFMLLPKEHLENIKSRAIKSLVGQLPFNLEMRSPNTGNPAVHELRNSSCTHEELITFIENQPRKNLSTIFTIKNYLIDLITPHLDACLGDIGLPPMWAISPQKATTSLYADPDKYTGLAETRFLQATHLVLLLNLSLPTGGENSPPTPDRRAELILKATDLTAPEWLQGISNTTSRHVLLGLWVLSEAHKDENLFQVIWGNNGILKKWLEGDDKSIGFSQTFKGQESSSIIKKEVVRHFTQALNKQRISPDHEKVNSRCLFTDEPTVTTIQNNPGLYEINVSAFTAREGKPDSIDAPARGIIPISHVSVAEHKLRADAYGRQTGKTYKKLPSGGSGVPTTISTPMTTGLFSALILNNEAQLSGYSLFDLARQKIEKGKLNYSGLEVYRNRYRLAKMERVPESLPDRITKGRVIPGQISILRQLLTACLRIGRPIHVFKGLPTPQKAFFYFDAMPSVLKQLIGFQELRLEQIPEAINQLNIAQTISSTAGLGYDVLGLYAMTRTRFSAICLTWCHANTALKHISGQKTGAMRQLAAKLHHQYHNHLNRSNYMSESDGALVRLGRAAARIQRNPGRQASTNVEMRLFNLCLTSALALRAAGQNDEESMIHGIAGELETNLVRKDEAAARKHRNDEPLIDECMSFAHQFVTEIWLGVLNGKPPAQKTRRLLGSVYRMAFLQSFSSVNAEDKPQTQAIPEQSPANTPIQGASL